MSEKDFIKRLLNALLDIDNHELNIKHDNNNFLEFENKNVHNTKIKSGHSRIVVDVFSNEEKKNGRVQMQNEKKNGHVQLLDLLLGWNFLEMMQSILMKMKERKYVI